MKALIPYAVLGVIGAAGAFAAVSHRGAAPVTPPQTALPVDPPAQADDGPVRVRAALDRTALPAAGGEAFVRVALEGVTPKEEKQERVPVSLTLVIDRSGSMGGRKMDDAKSAALGAIESLKDGDKVCVVSFDDGADTHGCGALGATGTRASLRTAVDGLFARGGTDMVSGLRVGGEAAGGIFGADRVNRVLLVSDGRPDTERGLRDQVAALAQRGITTTTLGLGEDYNEDLMSSLADGGLGHYFFVEKPEQLAGIFAEELQSLSTVVARQAAVELEPNNGAVIDDVIGFRFDRSGGKVFIPAGDIYGGRTTDILVRLHTPRTAASGAATGVVGVHVAYVDARTNVATATDRQLAAVFTTDDAAVLTSVVADVAAKAEKWRASQALLQANAAYDRGDTGAGNAILQRSAARLKAKAVDFADDELAGEATAQVEFEKQNAAGGAAWRGVGTKAAKKRAWSMNKGSAY